RDIDIAVYFRREETLPDPNAYETALEQELKKEVGVPVDVRVITGSPLPFAYTVISTGQLIFSKDERARSDFECRVLTKYHDFSYYRKRYRREALGLV
ncbi:MAG: nucleotidyltransferase domain-containing protein, partial [Methanoregulaceae archaeon]|nr:nucleotidyltransferase domain-containing protein [Methanoregulaceae archaeon]